MTAPQSLSAERREEVLALWNKCGGTELRLARARGGEKDDSLGVISIRSLLELFSSLDAQHAERTHAEVEKMREAAILEIQAEASDTEDGETLESLNRVIERLRALSIEGTG